MDKIVEKAQEKPLRADFVLQPLQAVELIKQQDIPDFVLMCESGFYRSKGVAQTLRRFNFDAIAIVDGISGLSNINTYHDTRFRSGDHSEEEQGEVIKYFGKVPVMVMILDDSEKRLYNQMFSALKIEVEKNGGVFAWYKNKEEAVVEILKEVRSMMN